MGREQAAELAKLAASRDPEERLTAAQLLCPCHVRRRDDAVWQALYALLEDFDARVRQRRGTRWKTAVVPTIPPST